MDCLIEDGPLQYDGACVLVWMQGPSQAEATIMLRMASPFWTETFAFGSLSMSTVWTTTMSEKGRTVTNWPPEPQAV